MSHARQALGRRGEAAAAAYLEEQGFRIVARNWRGTGGELDLVARDGRWLVFVEVRTRRGRRYGPAAASIDGRKQRRLLNLGASYVQQEGWQGAWRVDVVTITQDGSSPPGRARLVHYRHAVSP